MTIRTASSTGVQPISFYRPATGTAPKATASFPAQNHYFKANTTCVAGDASDTMLLRKPIPNYAGVKLEPGTMCRVLKRKAAWHNVETYGTKRRKGWVSVTSDHELIKQPNVPRCDRNRIEYGQVNGKAFVGAPKMEDINQGWLGDCWLIGGLAAVAQAAPQYLKNGIKKGVVKGEYTVDLHNFGQNGHYYGPESIKIDNWYPVIDDHVLYAQGSKKGGPKFRVSKFENGARPLWPAIIEKAMAQMKGGYDKLDEGGTAKDVFQALTGLRAEETLMGRPGSSQNQKALAEIRRGLAGDLPVAASTKGRPVVPGICDNHVYVVVGMNATHVVLRNPHDTTKVHRIELKQFCRAFEDVTVCCEE